MLVPDMAFLLGNIETNSSQILYDVLILRRADKESKYSSTIWYSAYMQIFNFKYSYLDVDWFLYNDINISKLYRHRKTIKGVMPYLKELSESRRLLINKIMSQAKIVVTDRLHASIYSLLIGKPHIVVDDKYKKIFNTRAVSYTHL